MELESLVFQMAEKNGMSVDGKDGRSEGWLESYCTNGANCSLTPGSRAHTTAQSLHTRQKCLSYAVLAGRCAYMNARLHFILQSKELLDY